MFRQLLMDFVLLYSLSMTVEKHSQLRLKYFVRQTMKHRLKYLKDYNMLIYGLGLMALMIFAPKGFSGINIFRIFNRVFGKKI